MSPAATAGPPGTPRLTVLSGPSGVGKTTVVERLRAEHPEVWLSVSATTRPPRPEEVDGVHYFFVGPEEFDRLVGTGSLLEWAEFAGNRYGTPRAPVEEHLARGVPVLLEIELEGARQVRAAMPEARLVFLAPPSWEVLAARLSGRGTEDPAVVRRRLERARVEPEDPAVVRRRLERARVELDAADEFDVVLVNRDVGSTVDELLGWLGSAEA